MYRRNLFTTLLFILFFFLVKAQEPVYKSWFSVSYEQKVKLAKKFKIKVNISQGLRISDIFYTQKYSALSEIAASKKITKFYKLGFSYRASYINRFKSRMAILNKFSIKLNPLVLAFRIKYQAEFEKNTAFSQDFRGKTILKWNANKDYRPYLFGEILYNNTYNFSNFNEFRLGIGLSADYKKKHNFDVMLMFVQDLNIEYPRKNVVLALEYLFSK